MTPSQRGVPPTPRPGMGLSLIPGHQLTASPVSSRREECGISRLPSRATPAIFMKKAMERSCLIHSPGLRCPAPAERGW